MTNTHASRARRRLLTRSAAAFVVCVGACAASAGAQQDPRFLAREQIILSGIGLKAEPAHQVVPKDVATIVSTFLQAPTLPDGTLAIGQDAEVRATLRGPSFAEAQELVVGVNTPFSIPPLTVAGIHTLENIRLTSHGDVLLRAVPESVEIEVIEKLLVTQVTARALTAAEIREKGIVFDQSSFQAFNFSAAFAIQDQRITIDFPVVLPQLQSAQDVSAGAVGVPQITAPSLPSLRTLIPDTLKLQAQIPNLSVVGFTLNVPSLQGQNLFVPPIPGVIVIPGDIGFLNQFFSVMLMVGNVAPAGSNLVVSNLQAEIVLPPGNDLVAGSGDDPLRMAHTATGESPRLKLVVQAGPDGQLGTADDIVTLGPGETGNAEFLVEGLREGTHVIEMQMTGTLIGLPVGPVTIQGRATGAVLVRNPSFTLTFTHPDVVTAGEPYTLDVTVTNTATSPANVVSVNVYPHNVSGATIVGSGTREIDTIAAGDSATVTFDLISSVTGKVTAATLDSADNVAGRFALKTGVGELGVPSSADSLVLPAQSQALPKDVRDAAVGLLGKAWAVATAPSAALPKDVQRFSKQIVLDRAVDVAEAGFRISLHEPIADSVAHLAMDVMGSKFAWLPQANATADDLAFAQNDYSGFDSLRRQSLRGDRFADAVAAVLAPDLAARGGAAFHAHLATIWSYRPDHVSAIVAGAAGAPTPYRLSLVDAQGRRVGGPGADGKAVKQLPFADWLAFPAGTAGVLAEMAVLASPAAGAYTVRLDTLDAAADGTPYVLSLVVPDASGALRQLTFEGVVGGAVPTVPASGDPYQLRVEVASGGAVLTGGTAAPAIAPIVDPAPTILGAVQQADADTVQCEPDSAPIPVGRVIAVLFSEEVTAASVQDKLPPEAITNYAIDGNQVVGVALQPGRRIAFLALRDPYGPFVQRSVTVSNGSDAKGHVMTPASAAIDATIGDDGGTVSGKVIRADGTPVPFANVRLFYQLACDADPRSIGISSKNADAVGRYQWDFVSRRVADRLVAVDPESGTSRDLQFTVQRNGQPLNVDIVFLGRGSYQGRTLGEDGRMLAGTSLRITSLTDNSQYAATTDASGTFAIGGIPVGNVFVEAVNVAASAQFSFSDNIAFPGVVVSKDITLLGVATRTAALASGAVQGFVYGRDGVTPVGGAPVIAYYQNRSQPNVPCPAAGLPPLEPPECPVAVVTSAATGAFLLDAVPAGELRIYAFDQASLAQGAAHVVLMAGATQSVNVVLAGGVGTVNGRVVDAAGAPISGARVGGGFSLTTTNGQGEFTLADVPIGHRDIVAVSDVLGTSGTTTVDIVREGEAVGVTIVLPAVGSVAGRVTRADGTSPAANITVYLFRQTQSDTGPQIQVFGVATTDAAGGYRIDHIPTGSYDISAFTGAFDDGAIGKVVLKFNQQVFKGDLRFRGGSGTVRGTVFDADGHTPLAARVGVSGDRVVVAGTQVGVAFQHVENFQIVDTPLSTGEYSFGGNWVGPFTVRAVGQFSPDPIVADGVIAAANETVNLDLRLQATSQITGVVRLPDGVTPVGENIVVTYTSDSFKTFCSEDQFGEQSCTTVPQGIQSSNAVTDANGRFFFPTVTAGTFTLTARDPIGGKVAAIKGAVTPGQTADVSLRLLAVADLTVRVFASDTTTPIPNAKVEIQQLAYPQQKNTLIAGPDGVAAFAGGDAFSEGELAITATDQRTGFVGRGSATIGRDGHAAATAIYLFDATGVVLGHVFGSDALTPVANAEVTISNAAGPLSFAVTGADGSYRVEQIPLGAFSVEAFDAATARRAFGSGLIALAGQQVPIDLGLGALGIVKGTLVAAGTLTPLKGWEIALNQLSPAGRALPTLATTTAVDGSWSFPGTSRGSFTVTARKQDVRGTTSATGVIDREGQLVDVPLVVTSLLALAGRVEGTVFNADGSKAADTNVDVCYVGRCSDGVPPVSLTTDAQGFYSLDAVPLGRFSVTATAQVTRNVGRRFADMELDGDIVSVDVALVGLTVISGNVIHADGTPAPTATVTLDGSPSSGCEGPCVQGVAPADATFSFVDVPARTFSVSARDAVSGLQGAAGGTVSPGEQKNVTIVLEPTGRVSGRVLRAAGQPAQGIVAELILTPGSPQERRLYVETAADGSFVFDPAPFAAFTLNLQDPAGQGVAQRFGTITANDLLGDIVLDEAPPAVATVTPASAALGVPQNQVVRIVFTEPIQPGTVAAPNVVLEGPGGTVGYALAVTDNDTVATLTPLSPLKDETRYTLRVEQVQDRVGKTMATRFTSTFTTVDITAPAFVSVSPGAGASGVPVVAPIRVQFSEPIDPARFRGPPVAVTGPQGAVPGRLDYTLGNTVVVFTPAVALAEAAAYHVTTAAAADVAGNNQAQGLDYTFTTTDRTPPEILALTAANHGLVIERTTTSVTADVGVSHDVALVDWYVNDVFTFAGRAAPFVFSFVAAPALAAPGGQIKISAIATDTSGNRGTSPVAISVTVLADQPPAVTIVAPPDGTSARNGDRIVVNVQAADDVGVTQIGYQAHTGQPQDASTRSVDPATAGRTESFAFTIPASAAPGSTIAIDATAVDTYGHVVQAVPVSVTVRDAVSPTVTITGTTSGAQVNPGQTTTAIVSVQDAGGVASVTFTVGGIASTVQTRTIDPAQPSVAASFAIQVPQTARPGDTLTLDATATDRVGNVGAAARVILPVADTVPPTVHLATENGSATIVPGRSFVVTVDADDEIAVSHVDITGDGAFIVSTAKAVSPPAGSAHAAFTINVPASAADGAVLNLRATATDIAGNVSAPIPLALTVRSLADVTLPTSTIVVAGETATATVRLSDPAPNGGQRIDFAGTDDGVVTVTPTLTFAAGETTRTIQVTGVSGGTAAIQALIQGVSRASMTVTVRGGIVRGLVLNSLFQPVQNAELTINGTVTATSNASGEYFAEGVPGPGVVVKAIDRATGQRGAATASMNRPNGFTTVNVVLIPAGDLYGDVKTATGAPAGSGVTVEVFDASDVKSPLGITFTDAASAYEFPVVTPGSYVLRATGADGHRGQAAVTVAAGSDQTVPIAFLGEGTVVGTVFDGGGVRVPRAPLTLTGISVFGATAPTTLNADPDGTFRFDRVPVGTFSVEAHDLTTGQAGTSSGAIDQHAQVVTADVHLSTFGSVRGTVRRPDGTTVVVGALVTVSGHSTLTDDQGRYSFGFLPLAPFTVNVNDAATRQLGRAAGTLTTQGETRVVDVVLDAQGSVLVTVTDAAGNPVGGATVTVVAAGDGFVDTLGGTTAADGTVLIAHVLSGTLQISASLGNRHGNATATLDADDVKRVTVALEPTGAITGVVFGPDGQTPAGGARVSIPGATNTTGADGAYRFDNLPLTGTYSILVVDAQGLTRAKSRTPIAITTPGAVVVRDFTMVGLGTVTGRVLNPDSSSASNLAVSVTSFNTDAGGIRGATTNAGGFYTVANVPVGSFTVSTGDASRLLLGEGAGAVAADGATVTIDILLIGNAVTPPVLRFDANNYLADVQQDGSLRSGSSVFVSPGGLFLDVVSGGVATRFAGDPIGTIENGGREVALRQQNLGGLNVTRKVAVPRNGYFARYLDVVSNPTGAPITVDLRVTSELQPTQVIATSSGDAALDVSDAATADRWLVVDDANDGDTGVPATAFVFDGAGGAHRVGAAAVSPTLPRELVFEWQTVTVPSNGTVAYLYFVAQQTSRAAAQASAERLAQLPPEALDGLSFDEVAEIANFAVAPDGASPLAALPSLVGVLDGHVLASDATTPIANATVHFHSANPFFGRTYSAVSAADGRFVFSGALADFGGSRAIAVDAFTLQADHPALPSLVLSPIAAGTFPTAGGDATEDVVFANTGLLRGTVRFNGLAIGGASLIAAGSVGTNGFTLSTQSAGDGSYLFALVPPGATSVTATATQQGTTGHATTTVVAAAATTAVADVGIDTIAPQIAIASPAAGTTVDPRSPLQVTVTATDEGGVASVALNSGGVVVRSETRGAPTAAARSEVFTVPFDAPLPTGGSITLSATAVDAAGNQTTGARTLAVRDVVPPSVAAIIPADGTLNVDPGSSVAVQFSEPIDRASIGPTSMRLLAGQTAVAVTFAFSNGDRAVTMTPSQRLALGTAHTVVVDTAVRDAAGNPLSSAATSVFTTRPPDLTPPKFSSIEPAQNAVDVSVGSFIQIAFTEPIDPATVTAASMRVSVNGVVLDGTRALHNGDAAIRFAPSQPLPFGAVVVTEVTSAITDAAGNALVDANGAPLQAPLTFTFMTASFGITRPARGEDVVEHRRIVLEARGSASLGLATMTFVVNGQTLPAVSGPPFTQPFDVPAMAIAPTLTIVATGRDSSGVQVAADQVVANVVSGLLVQPTLFGIPRGGAANLHIALTSAIATDLPITLTAGDPSVVTLPPGPIVVPAGQVDVAVPIGGAAVGNTTIAASSVRGDAAVVASVSVPVAKSLSIPSLVSGVQLLQTPLVGRVLGIVNDRRALTMQLLSVPAVSVTQVSIASSNPSVARVDDPVTIAAGDLTARLVVITGSAGTATLTFRAGNEVRQLSVVVGSAATDLVGAIVARPAGVALLPVPSLGRVITPSSGQLALTLVLLPTPAAAGTPVVVTSSNPAIASVPGGVTIAAGQLSARVDLVTGVDGTAVLTFNVRGDVHELTVVVGPLTTAPLVFTRPVGVGLRPRPVAGVLFAARTVQRTIAAPLLSTPHGSNTAVTITSSDPTVATVSGAVVIPAGQLSATFTVSTGFDGVATLTMDAGGERRDLIVIVGTPPASKIPAIVAPIVGITNRP